jgi:hypothetical protein
MFFEEFASSIVQCIGHMIATSGLTCSKSISNSAQNVTLPKHFSHPSLVFFVFLNPTHKTKTGTENEWETTDSNPLGAIKLSSQSTVGVRLCCMLFTTSANCAKNAGPKPFTEPNWHVLPLFHPILICRVTC